MRFSWLRSIKILFIIQFLVVLFNVWGQLTTFISLGWIKYVVINAIVWCIGYLNLYLVCDAPHSPLQCFNSEINHLFKPFWQKLSTMHCSGRIAISTNATSQSSNKATLTVTFTAIYHASGCCFIGLTLVAVAYMGCHHRLCRSRIKKMKNQAEWWTSWGRRGEGVMTHFTRCARNKVILYATAIILLFTGNCCTRLPWNWKQMCVVSRTHNCVLSDRCSSHPRPPMQLNSLCGQYLLK